MGRPYILQLPQGLHGAMAYTEYRCRLAVVRFDIRPHLNCISKHQFLSVVVLYRLHSTCRKDHTLRPFPRVEPVGDRDGLT